MSAAIVIKDLTKYYKNFKALDSISFDVQPGEFFGYLGPNGAGKSTTISVITGLANYNTGEVRVFGHDVKSDYQNARRQIGLVPQEFNFDPFLSAEQILSFEGGYFGTPWRESQKRAQQLLEAFGLLGKKDEGYKKLSGGMKRRLLIARALMHKPKVLILDEPTAGVDIELRHQLWGFLRQINQEGTTIVLTTHYIEEAEKLCSRIGVIHEGKIAALDPTETLVRKMSGDKVELHLKQPVQALPPGLEGLAITLEDGGKIICFEETGSSVARVLKVLHERQIEIEKIDIRKPTLEDAFLKLVSKKNAKLSEYKR